MCRNRQLFPLVLRVLMRANASHNRAALSLGAESCLCPARKRAPWRTDEARPRRESAGAQKKSSNNMYATRRTGHAEERLL